MSTTLRLPRPDGSLAPYQLGAPRPYPTPGRRPQSRTAYAAVHVVADPLADNTPGSPAALDWEATLAFRRHLWSYGLGVAEAMDTAQRGMGLDPATTYELIRRTAAESLSTGGGPLVCGAGTDQLPPRASSLAEVVAAYEEQLGVIEEAGARAVLMASRQLAAIASGPGDYVHVYGRLLAQVREPVVLHWLGPMFDPALAGYWGSDDLDTAAEHCLTIIGDHADKVDGIKVSLLDAEREVKLRRRLPPGVRLYTGDDFGYPELIKGNGDGWSDALLGIFDAIAPAASAALSALDAGDLDGYDEILAPTVPLARHMFGTPTYYYKTGITFLAWLAGHQTHFRMVGGLESGRSTLHLVELFELADRAGLLVDPELAASRMRHYLALAGVAQ
ncbi:MAG: DUF993 family protein [Streptosporangiales bacterium]|nr:DUF993 family protein [Streptosporangiales bacterium]